MNMLSNFLCAISLGVPRSAFLSRESAAAVLCTVDISSSSGATEPLGAGYFFASLAAGVIIALLIVLGMVRSHKSVRRDPRADSYIRKDSMKLYDMRDIYLYKNVERRARPKSNDRDDR